MKCAIFEEHSSSCVVYFRFSGTLFPVSMLDGDMRPLILFRSEKKTDEVHLKQMREGLTYIFFIIWPKC